ncbi:MAG TPA: transposase [Acidimicrobiia bacterium]
MERDTGPLTGYTGDITRFRTRHHYAAYNGTAPIEVSSRGKKGIGSTRW